MKQLQQTIERIQSLAWWGGSVEVAALEGGITNHNFLVSRTHNPQQKYVVRLGSDIPVHHISRTNELAVSRAAFSAGLSPAIRYQEPGVLVMDYIDGYPLQSVDVANQQNLERILPLIQCCHTELPRHLRGGPIAFWVFHVIRDYISTLKEGNSTHLEILPELANAAQLLESTSAPYDIVFAHNDLLSANMLDDGDKIWLIDWEYAGYNTPLFDLGGLASNNGLAEEQERWLLQHYFDREVSDELWLRYHAMKSASLLRETLWSMVSEIHSIIDFDYGIYTKENLVNFDTAMDEFRGMLR